MNRIVTNTEIKALLSLGTASDMLVEMWNDVATEMLASILGVTAFDVHTVTDERVTIHCGKLYLKEFPVDLNSISLKTTFDSSTIDGYSWKQEAGERRLVRAYDVAGDLKLDLPYAQVLATYSAGYQLNDKITVVSNTGLADTTITVTIAGSPTTYTFKTSGATGNQINVGATTALTAANIASKLGGSVVGSIVTLPLGASIALGSATSSQLSIVSTNLPKIFKHAVALIVGGGLAEKDKVSGISSYTIGGKQVTFRNTQEKNFFETVMSSWLADYQDVNLYGI